MTKWIALSTKMWLKKISLTTEVRVTLKHRGKDTRNFPIFLKNQDFYQKTLTLKKRKKEGKKKKQEQTP